jgi:arsenate reductase
VKVTILHNPRCSKSRNSLALLKEQGIEPDVRLYLENPPTEDELTSILEMLAIPAKDLLRRGEPEYKELGLGNQNLSEQQLIQLMIKHPKLIERPIVIAGGKAVIGRPPEQVLNLL